MTDKTTSVLDAHFAELKKQKAAAEKILEPLRKAREDHRAKMAPLEADLRKMNAKIKEVIAGTKIVQIDNDLARMARAMGATSMPAESASPPADAS